MSRNVPLIDIEIPRPRETFGDLDKLVRSIEEVGLLQPIVLRPGNVLIAGRRRIEAYRRLGRTEIDAIVCERLADAYPALRAEIDENDCRENPTPSEQVAQGKLLEELEKGRARARQIEAGKHGAEGGRGNVKNPSEKLSQGNTGNVDPPGKTRDIVGSAVGMSGTTYSEAKMVIDASEDESLPDEVRAIAIEARKKMDETGKVSPAYKAVRKATGWTPARRQPHKENGNEKPKETHSPRRIGPRAEERRLADFEHAMAVVVGACEAISLVAIPDSLSPERRADIVKDLKRAVDRVNQFRTQMERG